MLFAASVKITSGKTRRRIDVIVDAPNLDQAKEKAIKQARSIYAPSKKAAYNIITIINETEALNGFSNSNSTPESVEILE